MEINKTSDNPFYRATRGLYKRPCPNALKHKVDYSVRKVLVVDDYTPLMKCYAMLLKEAGIKDEEKQIISSDNFQDAVNKILENIKELDLIIIGDVKNSDKTNNPLSFAAVARAIAANSCRFIPQVAISTNALSEPPSQIEQLTASGVCDFSLDKPMDTINLPDVIKKACEMKSLFEPLNIALRTNANFSPEGNIIKDKLFNFACNTNPNKASIKDLKNGVELINQTIDYVKNKSNNLFEAYALLNLAQRAVYVGFNPEKYRKVEINEKRKEGESFCTSTPILELQEFAMQNLNELWDKLTETKERFLYCAWNPYSKKYDIKMAWLN